MKPYTVLTVPDPRLRKKASPIETVDDAIRDIFERMIVTMDKEDGLGLAATQVGLDKRLVVMEVHDHEEGECGSGSCQLYRLANPEIISHSKETHMSQEGCLSVPGQYGEVKRFDQVTLQYLDEKNKIKTIEADGLLADCIQHEIEHLDGILFIDHLPPLKRKMLIQKARKVVALKAKQEKENQA